jgi:hypothetical protein
MSVEYTYDEKANFIYTQFSGILTDEDLERQAKAVADDPRIKPGVRELVDLTGVEKVEASIESVGIIIQFDIANREKFEGMRTAIVAPADLLFGLSKIFEARSDIQNAPSTINVFRTMMEAKEWLGID